MKPLVIIPARGGSKGVPRKNIKLLNNKPLIGYTIEAALNIFSGAVVCVSTDDVEIKTVVENFGLTVPFLRPQELVSDTAGMQEVLIHALEYYSRNGYEADTIILLQPTSPFRTAEHIKQAIKLFEQAKDCEIVVSVKEASANPYYLHFEESMEGYLRKLLKNSFVRRQDCPKVYELNGAIYIIRAEVLKEKKMNEFTRIVKYEMNQIASHDIDTILDWQFAEFLVKQQEN